MRILKRLEKRIGVLLKESGLDTALVFACEVQFENVEILVVLRKQEDVHHARTDTQNQLLSELATEILQRSKYSSHSIHIVSEADFNKEYKGSTYNWTRR